MKYIHSLKPILVLLTTLLMYNKLNAQFDKLDEKDKIKKIYLKTNIATILEPDGNINLGVDVLGSKNLAYSADLHYIFFSAWDNTNKPRGFKIKPELRYYIKQPNSNVTNFYLSLEGLYTYTNRKIYSTSREVDATGNLLYEKRFSYNSIKNVFGAVFKFGVRTPLAKDSDKLFLDIYTGLGVRSKTFSIKNLNGNTIQNATSDVRESFDPFDLEPGTYPSLQFGIKICYRIK